MESFSQPFPAVLLQQFLQDLYTKILSLPGSTSQHNPSLFLELYLYVDRPYKVLSQWKFNKKFVYSSISFGRKFANILEEITEKFYNFV